MQTLEVPDVYLPIIEVGCPSAMILVGHQDVQLGEALFTSTDDRQLGTAQITSVMLTTFDQISGDYIEEVGLGRRSQLFTKLRSGYSDFMWTSEITLVQWG